MKRRAVLGLAVSSLFLSLSALGRASADEAQAMVRKAIDFYKKRGREAALQEFSREDGAFVDRELYVTVHALDGTCLADINPRIRGRNMIEERDMDGRYFTRDRLEAAKSAPSGWQEFRYFNPVSRKVELKRVYWERNDDLVFACGAYRSLMATM